MFWDFYYPILFLIFSSLILFFGLRKEISKFKQLESRKAMDIVYFAFNFILVLVFGGTFFAGSITRIIYLVSKT
ncbi:MAG: hypothetical protein J0M15_11060 [Deltaproteobacteria bacterium]|jgi:uncharacterized membrane protein|nr:hypothetical protein [Deltaproteobacteria bacterium]